MAFAATDEQTFVELLRKHGAAETARILKIGVRRVHERRVRVENKSGVAIVLPGGPHVTRHTRIEQEFPGRLHHKVKDGVVLIGSDAHFHPGIITTAFRGFVKFAKDLKPSLIIMNGDMLDGASISRHPPIGWESRPSLVQELEACKDRLGEVVMASPKSKRKWPLGNHDARFSTRLATVAPEYANVHGTALKHHFPEWSPCWSVWINDSVVVKHRYRGGAHSPHNNTVNSGMTMVCGHDHGLRATPFNDYRPDVRWGINTGTLADPYGPQFEYQEDNPRNHRSGFVVLHFVDGRLMQPQLVHAFAEGKLDCGNGKVIRV